MNERDKNAEGITLLGSSGTKYPTATTRPCLRPLRTSTKTGTIS